MIIYKATNQLNGKMYVGQTINSLSSRINKHRGCANRDSSFYFHNAIRKYGIDNFKWQVIRICDSIESLNAFEQYYILYYDSINNGYNMTSGGENYIRSEETKKKMSEATTGVKNNNFGKCATEESKKLMSKNSAKYWLGKKRSEESKEKNRLAHLGKKHTEESKQKMREATSGENNPRYGIKVSKETKRKMRKAHLGKKLSEETKAKMQIAQQKRRIRERI